MGIMTRISLNFAVIDSKIAHLETTVQHLHVQLADSQRTADGLVEILRVHERKHHCETLYAEGRIVAAAESLLEVTNDLSEGVRANKLLMDWLTGECRCRVSAGSTQCPSTDFTNRCTSTLELIGDEASNVEKYDEALIDYATALSLSSSAPNAILMKWAKLVLTHGTLNDALSTATKVRFTR